MYYYSLQVNCTGSSDVQSSSLNLPSFISCLAFCRSSLWILLSFLLMVRCIFSHINRARFPSSVSVTAIASILNVMSRLPRSLLGFVWSITHARTEWSIAWGLYLVRLFSSPMALGLARPENSLNALVAVHGTHARICYASKPREVVFRI